MVNKSNQPKSIPQQCNLAETRESIVSVLSMYKNWSMFSLSTYHKVVENG